MTTKHDTQTELDNAINDRGSDAAQNYWHGASKQTIAEYVEKAERDGIDSAIESLESYVAD